MVARKRYAAWTVVVLGALLAAVVPQLLAESASTELLLGLSVVGGAALLGGSLWDERIRHAEDLDERLSTIHHRAGWNAFWSVMGLLMVGTFAVENADLGVGSDWLVAGVMGAGMVVYMGSCRYLQRTM